MGGERQGREKGEGGREGGAWGGERKEGRGMVVSRPWQHWLYLLRLCVHFLLIA